MREEDTYGARAKATNARGAKGHKNGGGRNPGKGRTPQQVAAAVRALRAQGKQVPSFWDHDDDDQLADGGNVTEFQEYPKAVYPEGMEGNSRHWRSVMVKSREEEAEAMATSELAENDDDKRARLLLIGDVAGLKLDKRWSLDNLRAAITSAGLDPSADPTK